MKKMIDNVIHNIMELIEDGGESNYHKNSIYAIKKEFIDVNIAFVRFRYPNEGTYPWAYTIIDKDDIVSASKYKWGTTKDKIGNNHQSKDKPYNNPNRIVDARRTELLADAVNSVKKQK